MKTYSIKQLKTIAAQQGYKMAALETSNGERVQPFNKISVPINKQLDTITNRLMADLFEDGIYYVLMAQNINKSKSADRYPTVKGKLNPNDLKEPVNTPSQPITIVQPAQEVLTYEAALKYQQTISDLKNDIARLELEKTSLQEQLQEALDENELSGEEMQPSNLQTFLKEALPSVTPILDRYFDLEEKKLNLLQLKQERKPLQRSSSNKSEHKKIIPIVTGSQQHLELIELYYNKKLDDKLSKELDKLEDFDYELYKQVCNKLGIEIEEEEEGANE